MGVIALLSIGDERPLIVLYTRPVPRTGRSPHSAGHLSRGEITCDAGTYVPMHITRMTCYNHPCRGRTHLLHTAEVLPPPIIYRAFIGWCPVLLYPPLLGSEAHHRPTRPMMMHHEGWDGKANSYLNDAEVCSDPLPGTRPDLRDGD